jgi:hypothetical protein
MKTLKNIVFLFLLTHLSALSQNYSYEENFDGKTTWPLGNSNDYELKMYNGRYYFEHKRTDGSWYISSSNTNLNTNNDFEIETSIQKISGVDNSGISFMYDYKDSNNYREIAITSNGYFRVAESINGTYSNIKEWTKNDNVKTGNYGVNNLKITKKGNLITYYVNDAYVYSMTHKDFIGDKTAVTLYSNQKIAVDFIRAKNTGSSTNNLISGNKSILFEGFTDNKNDWAITNNSDVVLDVSNGDYNFDHKRETGGWSSTIEQEFDASRDFKITGQFKKLSGIDNNGFGLIYGRLDNNNQNEFFITSNGYYMIKKFENGISKSITEWVKTEHIKIGNGAYNYLEIQKEGNAVKFYINDNLVHTAYSIQFYGQRTGFIVYSNQKIAVGYLSMSYQDYKKEDNNLKGDFVLYDDFSSNTNNWSETKDENVSYSIYNGKYYLEHKKDKEGYLSSVDKYFDSTKDFEIETKLEHVSGDTNSPYGLLWGKKDTNYFQILITATGYYKINRVINNNIEEIAKWVKTNAINIGSGKENIIKVSREGDFYKFYINNEYLTRIDFEPFFGSEIGFGVYYKQKFSADYLTVKSVKSETNYVITNKDLTLPLFDNFDTNTNQWLLENAADYSVEMKNSKLEIERKKKGGIFISRNIDINTSKDFIIETAMSTMGNSSEGMYGLTFGRKNGANEFTFLISDNGSYKYRKFDNDEYKEIIPLTNSSAIRTGANQENKLKVVKSGRLLRFYINDQYVNEAPFENFFDNKLGYTIYYDKKIAVDYLNIKYQTDTYNDPPTIVISEPDVEEKRGFKIVEAKNILVRGIATDSDGIYEITINDVEANVSENGTFTANVPLKYGKNDLIVKATDLKQATSTKTFVIKRNSPNIDKDISNNNNEKEDLDIGFGKYYALVIGVSTYQDKTIPDLKGEPLRDAQSLADILASHYNFAKENVTLLKNPTENQIIKEFYNLKNKVGKNDNLVIFYAGHGNYDKVSEKGYWMPSDANMEFEGNVILNTSIVSYIKSINSKHTLLIADACFSGSILTQSREYKEASKAVQMKYALPSRKAITSGTLTTVPNESVFMKYLLKRLNDNTEQYLSAGQLFNMIEDPVINNTTGGNQPQYAPISRTGDEGGDFIFIKRK